MKEILLIDDDPIINIINTTLIKRLFPDAVIKPFLNGLEAIKFLQTEEQKKNYTIFLDINMPVMNGWEFLDALDEMETANHITLYILSSSIDKADKDKAAYYPLVKQFISKPLKKEVVEELLGSAFTKA